MQESWNTKFGSRRVKQALPTIDEALAAAETINDDPEQQLEIAASLLGIGIEEVRKVAGTLVKRVEVRPRLSIGARGASAPRSVVVEYRAPKRLVGVR